jgi:hypothetical protein
MGMTLDQQVRFVVYDLAMREGLPPSIEKICTTLSLPPDEIRAGLKRLSEAHMLVLQCETGEVLMANPFSAVATPFLVRSGGVEYFGNCIWDAFGIPSMLKKDAVIQTSCSDCGEAVSLKITNGQLEAAEGIAHFAVPARR